MGDLLHLSAGRVGGLCYRALRKLERHYRGKKAVETKQAAAPEPVASEAPAGKETSPLPVALGEDARITALRRAGPAERRRTVAERYNELRPPQPYLDSEENELLELTYWQGRTCGEIARLKGLAKREVGTRVHQVLGNLDRHLCGASQHDHQDEDRLEEVLLALNACGSVRRAARALKMSKEALQAFMERMSIEARTVFEVEV